MLRRYKYQREYRQNQKVVKKQLREHHDSMRREVKAQLRKERYERIKKFLKNPFAPKALTPDQELQKSIAAEARLQRIKRRRKWFRKFRENPFKTLFVRERSEEELQLEQWRKIDRKIAFRKRMKSNLKALKEIMKTPDLRNRFGLGMIQSTTFYILSFLFVYICYQLITIIISKGFNIPTIWYYYRVKFPLFAGSFLYTRTALISIFASGPLLSILLAFLFLKQYFNRKLTSQNLKLFFLWGFINGANMFFGSYISGFITRTEFIYASEWLFMSSMFDVEEIIFTIISITISLLIGRLITPLFLLSSGSVKLVEPRFRLYYVISHIFIPWFIGAIVFYLLTSPAYYIPFTLKTLTPVIILIPTLLTYNSVRNENIHVSGVIRKTYFRWSVVIALIALLFFYRILLNFGLQIF